ncbi:MAG: TetR/AcrR family transcriptional regulator [Bacteroidetes bacterium]|nr:TetR/AcrR family transcriptional regulator [Bacteroidota bacterium]
MTKKHIQIIEKAEELFATQGYEGTTVRNIADAAGVNLAMISYYFGSKEKLLEALFMERMNATKHRIEAVVNNQSLTPFQKIETLIDEYITRVEEKEAFYKIMLSEQVINKNTVVMKLLKELKLTYARLISSVIEEGQKQKVFRKDVDIVLMLTTMTGTVMLMLINKDYYREFNNQKKLPNPVFEEQLSARLREHVKTIFKAHLGYES